MFVLQMKRWVNRTRWYIQKLEKDEAKHSNGGNIDNKGAKVDSLCFNSINNVLRPCWGVWAGWGRGRYRSSNVKGPVFKMHQTTGHTYLSHHRAREGSRRNAQVLWEFDAGRHGQATWMG